MNDDELVVLARLCLLSAKRVLYACNVAESDLADTSGNKFVVRKQPMPPSTTVQAYALFLR